MYNKTIILGNLSKDIEIRYSQSGSAIANTSIATTRKFKGADGQAKEEVLFVDITFYGRTAEVANQYLRKGSKVLIDGRLKLDQWTDQQGQKRSKHKVDVESLQMLDSRESNSSHAGTSPQPAATPQTQNRPPQQRPAPAQPHQAPPSFPEMSDEIPF